MLKYETKSSTNTVKLEVCGTLPVVTAEATYLIHRIFCDLSEDKKAAQEFKRLVQAAIGSEDSPVWEVDA